MTIRSENLDIKTQKRSVLTSERNNARGLLKQRSYHFRYGASLFLCFLTLIGCSSQTSRQWDFSEIDARNPCFNGGRLILGPDSDISNLELEITRNSSGIYFYINLLLLRAPTWKEDPSRTTLTIQFDDQDPWIIHPYLLEGGQRLLLPNDVADTLIQSILEGNSFVIQIGRSQISVISNDFATAYQRFLDIPIEDEPCTSTCSRKPRPWVRLEKVLDRIKLVPSF